MVDNSEEKFLGQRGSYLIIEFINIINLKVLGGGGYGISVDKFGLDQFAFAFHGLDLLHDCHCDLVVFQGTRLR